MNDCNFSCSCSCCWCCLCRSLRTVEGWGGPQYSGYFQREATHSIGHHIVDSSIGGSRNLEIFLTFETEDALKGPEVLSRVEQIEDYLKKEHSEFVVKTNSLVNVVKNFYQVLNENRREMYIIP